MPGVHDDGRFVVGIVVNGGGRRGTMGYKRNCGGRQGTAGDYRVQGELWGTVGNGGGLQVTTGDGRQPQSLE